MSSGYGRIERAILASLLPPGRALVTRALTREVYQLPPRAPVNESQLASVRRALGALCAAGRVGRVRRDQSGQRWRRIGRLDPAEAMRHAAGKSSAEDDHVSLDDWSKLDPAARVALLAPQLTGRRPRFNKQENADIEWAQWSWNPITGCLHTCPYCYAREIATSPKMADLYPFGFAPTLHPRRLLAPRFMRVPTAAARDTRHRNVFLGSMADIFGRWVPAEWIEAVLAEVRAAPDWNFLCLTKFPKRMAEFDIPANCWMGGNQCRLASARCRRRSGLCQYRRRGQMAFLRAADRATEISASRPLPLDRDRRGGADLEDPGLASAARLDCRSRAAGAGRGRLRLRKDQSSRADDGIAIRRPDRRRLSQGARRISVSRLITGTIFATTPGARSRAPAARRSGRADGRSPARRVQRGHSRSPAARAAPRRTRQSLVLS